MIYSHVPTLFCLHACIRPSALAAAGGAQACPSHTHRPGGGFRRNFETDRVLRPSVQVSIYLLEKIPIFASKGSKGESYGLFTL